MVTSCENFLNRLAGLQETTQAERLLANYFETHVPQVAFSNLAEISEDTGLSKTTVTRFVRRLGYENFHDFIRSLRAEVSKNLEPQGPPLTDKDEKNGDEKQAHPMQCLREQLRESLVSIERTLEQVDPEQFDTVARLISDDTRPLYLMGVASSTVLLSYFNLLLRYFRRNVTLLDSDQAIYPHRLVDADSRAVLFALNIDRPPKATLEVLKYFQDQGSEIVVLTNRRSNPLLPYATHTLLVSAEGTSIFRTRCSAMAVLEALLRSLTILNKDKMPRRYSQMKNIAHRFNVFLEGW